MNFWMYKFASHYVAQALKKPVLCQQVKNRERHKIAQHVFFFFYLSNKITTLLQNDNFSTAK